MTSTCADGNRTDISIFACAKGRRRNPAASCSSDATVHQKFLFPFVAIVGNVVHDVIGILFSFLEHAAFKFQCGIQYLAAQIEAISYDVCLPFIHFCKRKQIMYKPIHAFGLWFYVFKPLIFAKFVLKHVYMFKRPPLWTNDKMEDNIGDSLIKQDASQTGHGRKIIKKFDKKILLNYN